MTLSSVPFRVKVALLLTGVILLFGAFAVIHARYDIRNILGAELETRGEAIARGLAANSVEPLLTDDLYALYELVNRTKASDTDIRYILLVSPAGTVRVSTFGRSIPQGLVEANIPLPSQASQLRRLKTEEGVIRDTAVPILQGKAGTVRIGMSDRVIEAAVGRNTRNLGMMAAFSAILGFAASYWLAYYLTRPLSQLVFAVRSVAAGNLSKRLSSPGEDEVGQLGKAFNTMAEALAQKEAARQALMKKVISSQEEERKRVARELHDELAQRLTSVVLNLETVENGLTESDKSNKEAICKAKHVARDSLAETRKLIGDLRPSVLDDLGLVPALRSYAETHLHAIRCEVTISAQALPKRLPSTLETAVFRITQEAINNIARHAQAKSARICFSLDNGILHGNIYDDGAGFEVMQMKPATISGGCGLGLQGMRERAELLGGTMSVRSQQGQGTSISFSIPLPSGEDHGE